MAHVRKQIRDAIKAKLTGLATTGSRVSANRVHPIGKSAEPTLAIFTAEEESERGAMGSNPELDRAVDVTVECAVQGTGFDDIADQVALEVEVALATTDLGGLVRELILTGTEFAASGEGEETIGAIRLTYRAEYVTQASTPDLAI